MYGAMREHAPSSTRLTGAASAAALTLALGVALANGMGVYIAKHLPDPLIYVALPDEPKSVPPPLTETPLETSSDTKLTAVDPVVNFDDFVLEDVVITGSTDAPPRNPPTPPGASLVPPKPPVRSSAKMLPAKPPAYPPAAIRKNAQGISSLEVCLNADGRVTAASLANSSGHSELDNAALKWVRDLRFTPAKLDGAPQAICGHSVIYEWKLKR